MLSFSMFFCLSYREGIRWNIFRIIEKLQHASQTWSWYHAKAVHEPDAEWLTSERHERNEDFWRKERWPSTQFIPEARWNVERGGHETDGPSPPLIGPCQGQTDWQERGKRVEVKFAKNLVTSCLFRWFLFPPPLTYTENHWQASSVRHSLLHWQEELAPKYATKYRMKARAVESPPPPLSPLLLPSSTPSRNS